MPCHCYGCSHASPNRQYWGGGGGQILQPFGEVTNRQPYSWPLRLHHIHSGAINGGYLFGGHQPQAVEPQVFTSGDFMFGAQPYQNIFGWPPRF